MSCSLYRSPRKGHFRHVTLFTLLFQYWLFHLSHGVHLTNTLSFTAIDLAKSVGMDDEDISAAIQVPEEEIGEGGNAAAIGAMEDLRKNRQDNNIPLISEIVKASSVPVLPLCCSMEAEDNGRYQCGGSSVSKESLNGNPNGGFRRRWIAPPKLVSTRESTTFKLEKSILSCQSATFAASLSLDANSSETHHFYPDGNLKFENEFYRINEYCVSSIRKDKVFLQICQANCTDPTTPCIHKCCGLDEVYSFGNDDYPTGCQPITRDFGASDSSSTSGERYDNKPQISWSPILYHDLSARLSDREMSKLHPHYILKYPSNFKNKCKSKKTTVFPFGPQVSDYLTMVTGKPFKNLQFRLRKDGWLLYPFRDSKGHEIPVVNRILNYCVDGAQHYGEMTDYINEESQSVLFLCSGGVDEAFENNLIVPGSEEIVLPSDTTTKGNNESTSAVVGGGGGSQESIRVESDYKGPLEGPSSVEIYQKSRQRPHILYQLFQLNSHSVPPNRVFNHNVQKLTKIKNRRPSIVNLFPNHPNRTKIITKKTIKKPKYQLPVCCTFPTDVNDGQTYHCRNRMVDLTVKPFKTKLKAKPIWNVPGYFMTTGQDSPFTLETSPVNCSFGKWQLQGFIHNFQLNSSTTPSNVTSSAVSLVESGILSDGYLKYENEFYRPGEFCVNGLSPRIIEVLICKPNCKSKNTPCIPKCCGMDEAYSLGLDSGYRGCLPLSDDDPKFHPTFFRNMNYPLKDIDQGKIVPHFIQRFPPTFQHLCYRGITLAFPHSEKIATQLNPESSERGPSFKNLLFRFRSDGKLMYTVPNDDGTSITAVYDRKEFCVDLITDYGIDEPKINHENQTILFICASHPTNQDENYR